jgi:hypothetical protein
MSSDTEIGLASLLPECSINAPTEALQGAGVTHGRHNPTKVNRRRVWRLSGGCFDGCLVCTLTLLAATYCKVKLALSTCKHKDFSAFCHYMRRPAKQPKSDYESVGRSSNLSGRTITYNQQLTGGRPERARIHRGAWRAA